MASVLVTGATGELGSRLVPRLVEAGHAVRALSRRPQAASSGVMPVTGDLTDGSGLGEALEGVDTVVHCASDPRHPKSDVTGTRNLVDAMTASGRSPHLVYVSIVGVDAIPLGYYRVKHQVEQLVERSGLPWTVQRATQFHTFVETMLRPLAKPPVMLVPRGFAFQPVATSEVAHHLAGLVGGAPVGRATDFGGPEVLAMEELARTWLAARGRRRRVARLPVPGKLGRAFRQGANVCPDALRGRATWAEHLASSG